jgi:hypothetical protein
MLDLISTNKRILSRTEMRCDGAKEMSMIEQAGAFMSVKDEVNRVVFGMPREAIKAGSRGLKFCRRTISPVRYSLR